jgi:septum formation protein
MLVLASKSPRRREILSNSGIPFEVRAVDVPEIHRAGEEPEDYVRRLAQSKAEAVKAAPHEVVLGADTVVVLGHQILEKPADADDARRMLRMLSGRVHTVSTGVCLRRERQVHVAVENTEVRFVTLHEWEIDEYVASGEPMDKAGGYAIQGLASKFIDRVEGCYFNVVGLPVALVYRLIRELELEG